MIRIIRNVGALALVAVLVSMAHADPTASAKIGNHEVLVKAAQDSDNPVIIARIDARPLKFVTTIDALHLKEPAKYWLDTSDTIQNMTAKTVEAVRIQSVSYDTFNTPVGRWTLDVKQESSNIPLLMPGAVRTLARRTLPLFDEVVVSVRVVTVRLSDQSVWQSESK
jgi:hypothetical protein